MKTTEIITKTVTLSSGPLPDETMEALRGLAQDYGKVKNYVYQRYSGIANVNRLTPVYSILNEMRYCGLRQQLNLPVVYYELAISEAVGDIKGMWGMLKNHIRVLVRENQNLSEEDRLYFYTVLKINSVFSAILNRQEYEMPDKVKETVLDVKRLNNLLCRLVRRHLKMPTQQKNNYFAVSPNGYRSDTAGLYLTGRIPRRRIFLPVKGLGEPDRQLRIILGTDNVKIVRPVDVEARKRKDYTNTIYAYIGYSDMLTLSNGNIYGKSLGSLVTPETERLSEKNNERGKIYAAYRKQKSGRVENQGAVKELDINAQDIGGRCADIQQGIEGCNEEMPEKFPAQKKRGPSSVKLSQKLETNNLGRKKYDEQKRRARERTQNFINAELNRMFREEKPERIVITKPVTRNRAKNYSKSWNRKMSRSFRGYIRDQIAFKCRLNTVELIEISSKGTGSVCSSCGKEGRRAGTEFICEACGYRSTIAVNSARNIERLAQGGESGPQV